MLDRAEKQKKLDALYEPYKKCLQCPLGNLGRTQVVFGVGNPDARLMIIGEAPGADEDLKGEPFVGRSGKLLTAILTSLGIAREDVFITNVAKCRPPNNRKPTVQESTICKNLLLFKQIDIIQPRVICTLGASAIEGLLGTKCEITKLRGQEIELHGAIVIPTLHPAYILRKQSERKTLTADLARAIELCK